MPSAQFSILASPPLGTNSQPCPGRTGEPSLSLPVCAMGLAYVFIYLFLGFNFFFFLKDKRLFNLF